MTAKQKKKKEKKKEKKNLWKNGECGSFQHRLSHGRSTFISNSRICSDMPLRGLAPQAWVPSEGRTDACFTEACKQKFWEGERCRKLLSSKSHTKMLE